MGDLSRGSKSRKFADVINVWPPTCLAASFLTLMTGLPRRAKNARLKSATTAAVSDLAAAATAADDGPAETRDRSDMSGTMAGLTRLPCS